MLSETEFHVQADKTLRAFEAALEEAHATGAVDIELTGDILTIELPGGKYYLLSKHAATRELWVSSPRSGGLHFHWREGWFLRDGRALVGVVNDELQQLAGVQVAIS